MPNVRGVPGVWRAVYLLISFANKRKTISVVNSSTAPISGSGQIPPNENIHHFMYRFR